MSNKASLPSAKTQPSRSALDHEADRVEKIMSPASGQRKPDPDGLEKSETNLRVQQDARVQKTKAELKAGAKGAEAPQPDVNPDG